MWLRNCQIVVFTLHRGCVVAGRFVDCDMWMHGWEENVVRSHVLDRVVHVAVTFLVNALVLNLVLAFSAANLVDGPFLIVGAH